MANSGRRVYRGGASSAQPKRSFAERNGSLMTAEEVADELAVTSRMIDRLAGSGELRVTKVGRLRRFHRDDLAAYIARQRGEVA